MKRTVWRGLLCLCAALALSAAFGASALAADRDISDFPELAIYLTDAATTDVGVITQSIVIPSTAGLVRVQGVKTLKGQGSVTITRGAGYDNDLLTVTRGATLTLENVTLDGGNFPATQGPFGTLVYVLDSGTLYMKSGATLRNNITTFDNGNGGGVYNNGTFIMYGGSSISNTSAGTDGGGVYNSSTGSFTITYDPDQTTSAATAAISGTSAGRNGGGVYNAGTFAIRGPINSPYGDVTVDAATVTGASAAGNGGGVYMAGGSFSVEGRMTIIDNTKGTGSAAPKNNVYLPGGQIITVTNSIASVDAGWASQIGVTAASAIPLNGTPVEIASFFAHDVIPSVRALQSDNPEYLRRYTGVFGNTYKTAVLANPEAVWASGDFIGNTVTQGDLDTYWGYGTLAEAFTLAYDQGGAVGSDSWTSPDRGVVYLRAAQITVEQTVSLLTRPLPYFTFISTKDCAILRKPGFTGSLFAVERNNTNVGLTLGGVAPDGQTYALTIDGNKANGSAQAALLYVKNGSLTLNDGVKLFNNKNDYTGTDHTKAHCIGGAVFMDNTDYREKELTINGGEICGNETAGDGGGIYCTDVRTFTMNGGRIHNNAAAGRGGGMYAKADYLNMYGGEIDYNTAGDKGGGVYCWNSTTSTNTNGFTMGQAAVSSPVPTIHHNTAAGAGNEGYGGGVFLFEATMTVTNAQITDNTAAIHGGGVYCHGSSLTLNAGGAIDGNTASFYAASDAQCYGAGVYANNGSPVTITGGAVNNNLGGGGKPGNGLYLADGTTTNAVFTMSGGEISGNTGAGILCNPDHRIKGLFVQGGAKVHGNGGAAAQNVVLPPPGTAPYALELTGALSGGAQIGVTAAELAAAPLALGQTRIIAVPKGYPIIQADADKFHSDDPAYQIRLTGGNVVLYNPEAKWQKNAADIANKTYSGLGSLEEAFRANSAGGVITNGKIMLLGSINVNMCYTPLVNCALTGGNSAKYDNLKRADAYTGSFFNVPDGVAFTLGGENANGALCRVGLDGENASAPNVTGSLVRVEHGGTLTLEDGALFIRNTISSSAAPNAGNGGGVYNAGTFVMNGGQIAICKTTVNGGQGGGVYNAGSFTINDGEIKECQASGSGGEGGGVYNADSFTMNDGLISVCIASGSGGGVRNTGTFTMKNGLIDLNTAAASGGGVYNAGLNASFTMEGSATIDHNAANHGGGVANMRNFTMNSGFITNNQAKGNGGGLYVGSGADVIMNGGSVTGNAAYTDPAASINDSNGGGVMVESLGVMTISGASTITGNHKGTGSAATANNLYLSSGKAVQWGDVPSKTTTFGVTTAVAPTDDTPVLIVSGTGVSGLLPTVTSDDPQYRPKQYDASDTSIVLTRPLRIATPPQNASADLGGTAAFTVTAAGGSGASTYSYQWQQNTGVGGAFVDIVGANQASYTVPPVTYDMHGRMYQCIVRDASIPADTLPSGVATLSVKHSITFTIQPAQETVVAQGYITTNLTAAASVSPPEAGGTVLLNWYACDQNGDISATPLPLGAGGTFPIPTTLSAGTYYFLCQGTFPNALAVKSAVAKVTVLPLPVLPNSITGITAGQSYQPGETVTFTAHGGGMELNPPYALNTTHWLPFYWETNPDGFFNNVFTQSFSTAGMAPGAHTLTATFVLERYDGANWVELVPRVTDRVSVPFTLTGTVYAPPRTGDDGRPALWLILCLAAGAGLAAFVLVRGRKRKQ